MLDGDILAGEDDSPGRSNGLNVGLPMMDGAIDIGDNYSPPPATFGGADDAGMAKRYMDVSPDMNVEPTRSPRSKFRARGAAPAPAVPLPTSAERQRDEIADAPNSPSRDFSLEPRGAVPKLAAPESLRSPAAAAYSASARAPVPPEGSRPDSARRPTSARRPSEGVKSERVIEEPAPTRLENMLGARMRILGGTAKETDQVRKENKAAREGTTASA